MSLFQQRIVSRDTTEDTTQTIVELMGDTSVDGYEFAHNFLV